MLEFLVPKVPIRNTMQAQVTRQQIIWPHTENRRTNVKVREEFWNDWRKLKTGEVEVRVKVLSRPIVWKEMPNL